ncbi:hypothetical protein [Gordonia polyisoprenivorans]|uniref:hypothetical protein n=2 Tax=Gordonia polyisoprenivorans TaxID=84595 RepID=UPI0026C2E875
MSATSESGSAAAAPSVVQAILVPTLTKQCWGFMIGSALFALGSAPWLGIWMGAANANICYFIGAWFFTAAGLIQVINSGPVSVLTEFPPGAGADRSIADRGDPTHPVLSHIWIARRQHHRTPGCGDAAGTIVVSVLLSAVAGADATPSTRWLIRRSPQQTNEPDT